MKTWFNNSFSLIKNTILIAIAAWFVITPIFENITIDSMLARFAVSLACIGTLFSKHQKIEILFFIIAFILIAIATFIYIRK